MSRPCDFCSASQVTHVHGLRMGTALLACQICTLLIRASSWEALATRAAHAVVARLTYQSAATKAVAHITRSLREMEADFTGDISPWNGEET